MQERVDRRGPRKVRKQILISAAEDRRLKVAAKRRGVSAADLIRSGLRNELARAEQEPPAGDWRERLARVTGMWADHTEIDDIIRTNRERWKARVEHTRKRLRGEGGE